jgi:CBS domain-containing protein
MRVKDVMSQPVFQIDAARSADAAFELMKSKSVRHLIVVEAGKPKGVISHRDLGGRNGASVRRGRTAGDLASTKLVTASPEDSLKRAASLLRGHTIGSLVVVENGKVIGIVTVSDLLDLLARGYSPPTVLSDRDGRRRRLRDLPFGMNLAQR